MAPEPDTLPLLPPPANDLPPPFSSHPDFSTPALHHPTRLHSAPAVLPPTSSSPTTPFHPHHSTLTQQTLLDSTTDTEDEDNASLLLPPAYTPTARYHGHASEEEYLAALRAWAEEKLYMQPGDKSALVGFYGGETMRERIARGPPPLRLGRKKGVVREGEGGKEGNVEGEVVREQEGEGEKRRRRSSIGNWLSRKRLWELENSITPENDQRCIICLDDCGSLSPETGLIEHLVRLPCHHLVGSRCIATWLHNNNTCPVCRRELFPAQRRPYSEHGDLIELDNNSDFDLGVDDDDSDDGDSYQDRLRLDNSVAIIKRSSQQLHLSPLACRLSYVNGRRVLNLDVVRYCSRWAQAAMSVFVASHLLDHPVTLEQISRAVGVPWRIICDTYRLFYRERETVIDGECLLLLRQDSERSTTESPAPLSWPPPEYTDAIWEMIASELGIEPEAMLIEILVDSS